MRRLEGWGRFPVVAAVERRSEDLGRATAGAHLARGLGRSYGDASLPPAGGVVASTVAADRVLGFDPSVGVLHAEAGLTLGDLERLFWPRGWTSPVLPGTSFVTLGGMVAADVHGKEHHVRGTFGAHVEALRLRLPDGDVIWADRSQETEAFRATLGGMGLTGHILEVRLRLQAIPSAWIEQETERFGDLAALLDGLAAAAGTWPYTMAWIDCLHGGRAMGRGILYRGRWVDPAASPEVAALVAAPPRRKRSVTLPIEAPPGVLNRWVVAAFNEAYFRRHGPGERRSLAHPEDFLHPLDAVLRWNRGYGRRGFTQYQCVVPTRDGARRVLGRLVEAGAASFLCVLKDCGEEGEGLLSFPRPGTSLAVDLPIRRDTPAVVDRLNDQVLAEGGRIYLAKDTFSRAADYRAMDPRVDHFLTVRRRLDPQGRLTSLQSRRLFGW
ncbi:MAG: FAD-binding oxidoreductase [Acidobacteriota bacterium]